ncbi:hypothetical protein PoB_002531200 [Plakobranchus ocellatus]|uniref:Uncharacterized protein n=1 Tax=Plakobranchus ocellatus TaxID=259542 RepID=A0AAV3ZUN2_9GAST|nr:hypothetical protein PoB_002531200 [Plakobranchus ocellatus]
MDIISALTHWIKTKFFTNHDMVIIYPLYRLDEYVHPSGVSTHPRAPSSAGAHEISFRTVRSRFEPPTETGVDGSVASESALRIVRSAGTLLSRARATPPAPWPDGGSESLKSPYCGLAIYKNPSH